MHRCALLTKALRPPPDKRHGLGDTGTRYRYRELDLLANESTRELFVTRAKTVDALRAFMAERGFIEVETPVLQALAGGASARPFLTHHNALDQEVSLRISVELYLNRCLIGGLENVYDLGKCFRNEGISYRHSPEFTMLEWLMSYSDHKDVARFTEEMVAYVAQHVLGTTVIERGGEQIDLAKPWRNTTMQAEILRVTGVDFLAVEREELMALLEGKIHPDASWAQAVQAVYSKLVEPTLNQPTHVYDFPLESFPITKAHAGDSRLAEHFDAVIGGIELVSGDSEVNDPVEQYERFRRAAQAAPRRRRRRPPPPRRGVRARARVRAGPLSQRRHGCRPSADDPHRTRDPAGGRTVSSYEGDAACLYRHARRYHDRDGCLGHRRAFRYGHARQSHNRCRSFHLSGSRPDGCRRRSHDQRPPFRGRAIGLGPGPAEAIVA